MPFTVAQAQAVQKLTETIHGSVHLLLRNIAANVEPELLTRKVWKELYGIIVDAVEDGIETLLARETK